MIPEGKKRQQIFDLIASLDVTALDEAITIADNLVRMELKDTDPDYGTYMSVMRMFQREFLITIKEARETIEELRKHEAEGYKKDKEQS